MTLDEARGRIGATVTYRPWGDDAERRLEFGRISSVNERFVFVTYGGDQQAKATNADDLRLTR